MTSRPQARFAGSVATARSLGAGGVCRAAFPDAVDFILSHWRAMLLLLALGSHSHASAADERRTASESSVKAAYLYKFASYVEWPASAFAKTDTPFTIGVIGADAIVAELNKIKASVNASGRALEIRELRAGEPATGVHVLFYGLPDVTRLGKLLATSATHPVLTITDASGALEAGSIINFVEVGDHIRFEVSLPHADRAGIKVSVRLLNVAHRVVMRKS